MDKTVQRTVDILVIEDMEADVLLLQRQLRRQNLNGRFQRVESFTELETALNDRNWDVVLSDYNVPGLDIRDSLTLIRTQWPDLPVILISGGIGEEEAVELLKQGAWDFILKDRLGRLVPAIERALMDAQERVARRGAEMQLRLAAAVFTNTQEGVFVTDSDGNFLAINPSFTVITEYTEQEVLGLNVRLLQSGRQDRAFYLTMWHEILTTGSWQGEIWNRRKGGAVYPEWLSIATVRNEEGQTVNYVGVFTDLSRVKQSEEQLRHLAHHDPLTDLPNRLLLRSRLDHALERARRKGGRCAVLFLDLDHFKVVNDSLGHSAGDELLQITSRRLRERLRDVDTLARLGGDEFVVVVDDLPHAENAATIAQDLIERITTPYLLSSGHRVCVGGSIGISLFPEDGSDADVLIQHADSALYQAKEGGRNTYRFYTKALTDTANERLSMEAGLRRALERHEFVLHYQPLIAQDGHVEGVEALVRWADPEAGLVPPSRFIPLAEDTGLIVPLGEWVLREACSRIKSWLDAGLTLTTLAVNLSPRQFRQTGLHERISMILAETGLPPHYLELEITESAIMEPGRDAERQLAALKDLGVRLAIDDFGTGYSSLAHLRRFPLDKLKIDQSFVRDIPCDSAAVEITSTIIAMARNLQLRVLAEGVETQEQLDFLTRQHCDSFQGYLFSRPLPADELQEWLRSTSGRHAMKTTKRC